MASIFLDSEGVIMIEKVEKGKTNNGQYYASEVWKPEDAIKLKHRRKLRAGVFMLQDNPPVRTAQSVGAEATKCDLELLSHPLYSPDLAPSDFFLSPKLKFHMFGKQWWDHICFMEDQDIIFFHDVIITLEHH